MTGVVPSMTNVQKYGSKLIDTKYAEGSAWWWPHSVAWVMVPFNCTCYHDASHSLCCLAH